MHPSWPKRDQAAIAPLSAEQSYFRPSLVALWEMESIGSTILCSFMDEATKCAVNGARLPQFTVPFTSSFTRTSGRTLRPKTRCIQTRAGIRTRRGSELGWSDPVFTATKCVAVAPAQCQNLHGG
jgi:hypothetical protein